MEDTICSIATSSGVGAISIIRVSGQKAISIVNSIFSNDIKGTSSHSIKYGYIMDNKEKIDEVLLMIMLAPKTYTTEDTVEINCHGGYTTTNRILELLLKKGCRLAEPGEFTKRAFLNGRINLLEAESVNELIVAKSDSQRKLSLNQLGGKLTSKINEIRELLLDLMANIEVNIDYPEYTDNLEVTTDLLNKELLNISKKLQSLVEGSKYGKIVARGIDVAIIGKPNVGKSSILNHLLDEEKAIVTDIAGTTRDTVEGSIILKGIPFRFIDTAGIRETTDLVEKIGVEKSNKSMENADITILVLDGSKSLEKEDEKLLSRVKNINHIVFVNKNDILYKMHDFDAIYGNTKMPDGLDDLKNKLIEMTNVKNINKDLTYLSNARQIDLINKAYKQINNALSNLKKNITVDLIEIDLKKTYDLLSELLGYTYDEDVINKLFANFCVGK